MRITLALLSLVVFGLVFNVVDRKPTDRSAAVQDEAGASTCWETGFYIKTRVDGHKSRIYTCVMRDGATKCVTEEDGIASDSTEAVRFLFANALGTTRPDCIS